MRATKRPLILLTGWLAAAAGLLLGLAAPAAAQGAGACPPRPAGASFRTFNGMSFAGQPDLSRYGLEPIHIIDRGIWRNEADRSAPPDPARVRQVLRSLPNDGAPVVLDIEDFDPGVPDSRAAAAAMQRLIAIHSAFRAADPRRRYGYYSFLPGRDYWRAIRGVGSPEYRAWQRQNDRLSPLERRMDLLFPSLYAFYADEAGWVNYARAQICEARRISSKPVYVFLWFEYHPAGDFGAGRFLPARFWRLQLETARRYADGVIIWGGFNLAQPGPRQWDANAPWWRETMGFLSGLRGR